MVDRCNTSAPNLGNDILDPLFADAVDAAEYHLTHNDVFLLYNDRILMGHIPLVARACIMASHILAQNSSFNVA